MVYIQNNIQWHGKGMAILSGIFSSSLSSRWRAFSHELILEVFSLLTSNYKGIILISVNGLQTIPPLSKFKQPSWSVSGRSSPLTSSILQANLSAICSNGNMWHNPELEYFGLGKEGDLGEYFWETTLLAHNLWLEFALFLLCEMIYFDMNVTFNECTWVHIYIC